MLAGLSDSFTVGDDLAPASTGPRASPGPGRDKSSSWIFRRVSSLRFLAYLPLLLVRAFVFPSAARPSCCSAFRLWSASLALPTAEPTMPSADFCPAVRSPLGSRSRLRDTEQISRGKFSRLPRTVAGSTLHALDGYGLCGDKAARPTFTPPIRFLSIDSRFCSTLPSDPPRGGSPGASLTLHPHQVG